MKNPASKALDEIKEASKLPNRTKNALSEESQTPSDLKAIARSDKNSENVQTH